MSNFKTFLNWHLRYNASLHTHFILFIWPQSQQKVLWLCNTRQMSLWHSKDVKKWHDHKKEYKRAPCNVLLWRWLTGFTYQSAAYLSCHLLFVEKNSLGAALLLYNWFQLKSMTSGEDHVTLVACKSIGKLAESLRWLVQLLAPCQDWLAQQKHYGWGFSGQHPHSGAEAGSGMARNFQGYCCFWLSQATW